MRERVRGLGGRLSFGMAPGGGGLIEAAIPSRSKNTAEQNASLCKATPSAEPRNI
jgi:hypothetical protein